MFDSIQKRKSYFLMVAAFIVIANLVLFLLGKRDSFLLLNTFHNSYLDQFFLYITYIGDGIITLLICLALFLFKKKKESLFLLISFLLSGIISLILKNSFNRLRPICYSRDYSYHKFIEGFTNSVHHSFPSGHTTTIFALATMFVFFTKKKAHHFLAFFIAIVVGFSRIYLGQHFLEDIIFGAIIGTMVSLIIGSFYLKDCAQAEQKVVVG